MGAELGRRRMLQVMGAVAAAVMIDALPADAATGTPIPADSLRRAADQYNGTYVGKWVDSTGKHGTASGRLAIDPADKQAKASLGFDGKILGRTGLSKQSMTVDLSRYDYDSDTSTTKSPVGPVTVERVADGAQVTLDSMAGLPAGSKVEIVARLTAPKLATFTYTITPRTGTPIRGAVNLGQDAKALPDPVVPSATSASSGDLVTGAYACKLITKAQATKAFGEPSHAPQTNGGRLQYQPGVDSSNCIVKTVSGNQILQMTVYHTQSAAAAQSFFTSGFVTGTPVPGLESRAFSYLNGRDIWLLRGNDVVQLEVIDTRSNELPPALAAFTQLLAA